MRLQGKVALITGGGIGIGAAVARRFAAEGASVVVMARRAELVQAVAAEVGGEAVVGDAAEPSDAARAVETACRRFGGLDVVVANAGQGHMNAAGETSDEQWAESWRANPTTGFCTMRAALPALIERRGAAVMIASVAGIGAGPRIAAYTTSKHAVIGLTRSLARDYGPYGVRVNAVCPGWVSTSVTEGIVEMVAEREGLEVDHARSRLVRHVPLQRMAEPDELASVCLFLASSEASFVTGAVVIADGGAHVVDVGTLAFG
jgi:meso-butanediol dehydrogenase / (S,S)-butanediol dehydrogenase / diacetyl reductase